MKPIYLVRGSNPSFVLSRADGLIGALVGEEDESLVVERFDADDLSAPAISSACLSVPFLASKRVLVIRQAGALSSDVGQYLVQYLDSPNPTTAIVLLAGGGQLSAKLTAAVGKRGEVIDADPPKGVARQRWLADVAKQKGMSLTQDALEVLMEHLGEDLERIQGLFEMLAASAQGGRFTSSDILPYLGELGDVAPWALTDAIAAGDIETALVTLARMTSAGNRHPLVVMSMLHKQLSSAFRLVGSGARDDSTAAAVIGGSPYSARKPLSMARKMGYERLAKALILLGKADLDLRGNSGLEGGAILEVLVARIGRLVRQP